MVYNSLMTQPALLNLETKNISPYWVDPNQPLKVPVAPLHYEAHKLQLILERLENQAERNPAQFNSGNYLSILNKLARLWERINNGETEVLDEGGLAENGNESGATEVGARIPLSVDSGVPTNDSSAGQRPNPI